MTLTRSQNLIGGRWADPSSREHRDLTDPATGQLVGQAAESTPADVDAAAAAAAAAAPGWGEATPRERAEALSTWADALAAHRDELAALESANVGKPILLARGEVDEAVDCLRFYAGAVRTGHGLATGDYRRGTTSFVRREPLGAVGLITAWNFPLMGAVWKAGAALAAGNTCVLKPAEQTPLTTLALGELSTGILPAGVLNVVTGGGAAVGAAVASHPGLRMVSLTGAVSTGTAVATAAAATLKRVHLELGGNCPVVVLDDADLEAVALGIRRTALVNSGQVCLAAARVLVDRSRHDELVERLLAAFAEVRVGNPAEGEEIEMGPLAFAGHRDRVAAFLASPGTGRVLQPHPEAGRHGDPAGAFLTPTVVTGASQYDAVVQEEIFGPVVTVQPFEGDAEAVAWANGTAFGLAASLWTTDLARAMTLTPRLDFGTVWLNDHLSMLPEMPHGGRKASGYGSEGSALGLEEFTQVKHVWVNHG